MPKTDNKEKLRKAAKGLGLGLLSVFATIGIVATIACLARCGEQPKQEASAEGASLAYVRQPRKDAPTFDMDANIFKGDDLMRYVNRFYYGLNDTQLAVDDVSNRDVVVGKVNRAGLYWLHVGKLEDSHRNNAIFMCDDVFFGLLDLALISDGYTSFTYPATSVYYNVTTSTAFDRYVAVTQEQVDAGFYVVSRCSAYDDGDFGMYACDLMQASPRDKVSLPEVWKPFNLMDYQPIENGFGLALPRTSAGDHVASAVIDGLLFRSNGKLYNTIQIVGGRPFTGESNNEAHTFGYYNAAGELVWKSMHFGFQATYMQKIIFGFEPWKLPNAIGVAVNQGYYYDDASYCPMTTVYVDQGDVRDVYLSAGPLTWNSPLFRDLDVLDVYDEEIRPVQTLVDKNPLEWLRLSLASVNTSAPTTDVGLKDGMTLVSDGIVAFMPILGIEVLPSISLGLLLILPLIGGIIVLIVKVFSK